MKIVLILEPILIYIEQENFSKPVPWSPPLTRMRMNVPMIAGINITR
jgi:hypothetical protein